VRSLARASVVLLFLVGSATPAAAGSPTPDPVPSATPAPSATAVPSATPAPLPSATPAASTTPAASLALAAPRWERRIGTLVGNRKMSVAIGYHGRFWYRHLATVPRIPASNEKLLLSMALFDRLGTSTTIPTFAKATSAPDEDGVIDGTLWMLGRGDPEVDRTTTAALAKQIRAAGVTKVRGRVRGSTSYFGRDWWAKGWKGHFTADEIPFPTALTFLGNVGPDGRHIRDPERRAAASLTTQLRKRGIAVSERPGMGDPRSSLVPVASVGSDPLKAIVRRMDVDSLNFHAEVLGKLLGAEARGAPGTIAKGAAALEGFEAREGVGSFEHHDGSGLSYENRVRAQGIVRLLWAADGETWGPALHGALPRGGQGTLEDRLHHVRVRAKTGTLDGISALSGWVWLERRDDWATFSIVSRGMSKATAVHIEDAIVRIVSARAG
jgi:D-alanyl-D-alanine carboxypeptidase